MMSLAKKKPSLRALGFFIPLTGLLLGILLAFAALAIDIGRTLWNKRKMQIALDAGAFAAVDLLPGTTIPTGLTLDEAIAQQALAFVAANDMPPDAVTLISCGQWIRPNFTPLESCANSGVNAVRLEGRGSVPTMFARVIGFAALSPRVQSIAVKNIGAFSNCIRPIGIAMPTIVDLELGDTFTIQSSAGGNWTKLDIGGNMSSGNKFLPALLNGTCNAKYEVGETVSSGTGFGGSINKAFDQFSSIENQHKALGMPVAVIPEFVNGNADVTIMEFIRVDFVSQTGNGFNWEGTFRLLERNIDPPDGMSAEGHLRSMVL
jgi:hypothetical protein